MINVMPTIKTKSNLYFKRSKVKKEKNIYLYLILLRINASNG